MVKSIFLFLELTKKDKPKPCDLTVWYSNLFLFSLQHISYLMNGQYKINIAIGILCLFNNFVSRKGSTIKEPLLYSILFASFSFFYIIKTILL